MRVLAIDPSSTDLGWAVLDSKADDGLVDYGVIRVANEHYHERIPAIIDRLTRVVGKYQPDAVACEEAIRFKGHSIPALQVTVTAIKRWAKRHKVPFYLYNPSTWKHSVIGHPGATKQYVAQIIRLLFRTQIDADTSEHITDAIAIGLHHLGVEKWHILGMIERPKITGPSNTK